jgi:Zn-finger nucleic acid-binding protein
MPDGTGLPLLAAAVEKMMNGWFKSNRSKSRGVWMDKNEFDELLRDEMSIIEKKLKPEEHGDKVMKNLQNAFQMGVTDRFRFFFNEIDLHIEENEWNAINARNAVAHGRITDKQKEGEELIQHTDAYKTLIHKILLRLLEYSGSYIDRSALGWEEKQLV